MYCQNLFFQNPCKYPTSRQQLQPNRNGYCTPAAGDTRTILGAHDSKAWGTCPLLKDLYTCPLWPLSPAVHGLAILLPEQLQQCLIEGTYSKSYSVKYLEWETVGFEPLHASDVPLELMETTWRTYLLANSSHSPSSTATAD